MPAARLRFWATPRWRCSRRSFTARRTSPDFLRSWRGGLLPLGLVFARFKRRPHEFPLGRLLCWALAFRLCGLWGVPVFEDDWFRYLWDGYRFFETGSPYGFAPMQAFADESVPAAFQRILDQINNPHLPTIYGPTTEYAFLFSHMLAPASLTPFKASAHRSRSTAHTTLAQRRARRTCRALCLVPARDQGNRLQRTCRRPRRVLWHSPRCY